MRALRFRNIAVALAAGVALAGCTSMYGGYGGHGGYGGYGGGSGVSISIGTGGGYGGYYDPYYSGYYGSPYWGWYDGYYYPGTGYHVYDSYRRPRVWSD